MLNNFTYYGLYTWVFYVLVLGCYFLGGGIFAAIDFLDLAPKYKLQPAVRRPYFTCVAYRMPYIA